MCMRRMADIPKKLKNVTDNQGNGYPRTISNKAARQGVPHFFDMSNSEIKSQNIDDSFAPTGHGTCRSPGERVRTGNLKDILKDDKGTTAGNGTEKNQRQQLNRYVHHPEKRMKDHIYKIEEARDGQTVNRDINANHKGKNFYSCF